MYSFLRLIVITRFDEQVFEILFKKKVCIMIIQLETSETS